MGAALVYQETVVEYRRADYAWQRSVRLALRDSPLRPGTPELWWARRYDSEQEATTAPLPPVLAYRVPYAKSPRSQIRWKRATAPVVGARGPE